MQSCGYQSKFDVKKFTEKLLGYCLQGESESKVIICTMKIIPKWFLSESDLNVLAIENFSLIGNR